MFTDFIRAIVDFGLCFLCVVAFRSIVSFLKSESKRIKNRNEDNYNYMDDLMVDYITQLTFFLIFLVLAFVYFAYFGITDAVSFFTSMS